MPADDRADRETEAKLAGQYLEGAVLAREVSHKALQLALQQIEDGTLKNPASAAMNAAITSGTLLDKRFMLQERPTQHIAVDPTATLNALARKVGLTYEGTATELPTPELQQTTTQHSQAQQGQPERSQSGERADKD